MAKKLLLFYIHVAGDNTTAEASNPKVSKAVTDEKKTAKNDTDIMVNILIIHYSSIVDSTKAQSYLFHLS